MISVVTNGHNGHGPNESHGKIYHRAQSESRFVYFTIAVVVPVDRVVIAGDIDQHNRWDHMVVIIVIQPSTSQMDTDIPAKDIPYANCDRGIWQSQRSHVRQRDRRRIRHEIDKTAFGRRITTVFRPRVQTVQLSDKLIIVLRFFLVYIYLL